MELSRDFTEREKLMTTRKRVSDGNGGEIEVREDVALIIQRIDGLSENMKLRIENVREKVDVVAGDLCEVKENVKTLYEKYDDLKDSLHAVDKEATLTAIRSEERIAENSKVREWMVRGLIGLFFSGLGILLTFFLKTS